MERKKLPAGKKDFKEIIGENYYFVDKSELIKDILDNGDEVFLFTRPRRFGKSLNMSMIETFFNIEEKEENKKYFENLNIFNKKYSGRFEKEQGKYPVISISLKDVKAQNWEKMFENLKYLISEIFRKYYYLFESLDKIEKEIFNKILERKENSLLEKSIKILVDFLYKYYGKKVIVLIDEYDAPVTEAFKYGFYDEAINFFRLFYGSVLKDNSLLKFGVLTGIVKITQQSIFSDLNNVTINSVMNDNFSQYFGLTENEVEEILHYYELNFNIVNIKNWYNGYLFGNTKIYNPWSIIYCIKEKNLDTYWINTSRNDLINDILYEADNEIFEDLKELLKGKSLEKPLFRGLNFVDLMDNFNNDTIWQLFLDNGYLTFSEPMKKSSLTKIKFFNLKIPNEEVKSFFEETFITRFLGGYRKINDFMKYLYKKDTLGFEKVIQNMIEKLLSINDLRKINVKDNNKYENMDKIEIKEEKEKKQELEYEKFYHIFMLGIMSYLMNEYDVSSNRESGYGYYDIILEPLNKNKEGYIFEFKLAKNRDELEKKAIEGYKQILEKDYEMKLRANGIKNISKYSLAFWKKKVKVCDEKMYLDKELKKDKLLK